MEWGVGVKLPHALPLICTQAAHKCGKEEKGAELD